VASLELEEGRIHAVVSATPRSDAEVIRALGNSVLLLAPGGEAAARAALDAAAASGGAPPVLVGDADAWASSWGLAASVRELAVVVVHGGANEYRALIRERVLPPLLDDAVRQCWVVRPGEQVVRAEWPMPSTTTETAPQTNNAH
jgi:S-DNA-T family DNA segregation ATPase FtsK/SpoIIIE